MIIGDGSCCSFIRTVRRSNRLEENKCVIYVVVNSYFSIVFNHKKPFSILCEVSHQNPAWTVWNVLMMGKCALTLQINMCFIVITPTSQNSIVGRYIDWPYDIGGFVQCLLLVEKLAGGKSNQQAEYQQMNNAHKGSLNIYRLI